MQALMQFAAERGDTRVVLRSQCSAEGFYAHLGFSAISEPFDEAGIPHIDMACHLGSP
jgi:predicted GNAT family N-acyltransferase